MLYLLVVGGGGVVLLLIVAVIVLAVVCCKLRNRRRGGRNLHRPVPVSASKPIAETTTQESTFTEEEQPVPAPRNVDIDGVTESPLESVSHHITVMTISIIHVVFTIHLWYCMQQNSF